MLSRASGSLLASSRRVAQASAVAPVTSQVRNLNIHEYASMELMKKHNVPTPAGIVCTSADEAAKAYEEGTLGSEVVVKAQVLAGGRGKGTFKNGFQGGVRMASSADECKEIAGNMIGQELVTKQTGEEGKPCDRVYIMEKLNLDRETYFSILMDRAAQGPVMVGSPAGGMNIEEVAEETPELIFTEAIDIVSGVQDEQVDRLARNMGFKGESLDKAKVVMTNLYNQFISTDGTLVEINPLAETPSGDVYCCDAKLNFDDNADFRQKDVFEYRDRAQEDPREVDAAQYGLNYIGLDGSIGCLVNGAGLAMATMDIIKLNGGSPANFLDVGGGATKSQVQKAFEILNADKKVHAIFVNIFGGIMRCDVIAAGVVAAAKEIGLKKPIIIRLQGTNVNEAKTIINESGLKMFMTDDLDKAANVAVKIADIVSAAEEIDVEVSFDYGK
mmetsp:Transcript_9598/g.16865  ORF Transcript_9598/g.16865 Transcript_9598/m.16865 type:complete len:444 (+) Transcript_9598:221-1552(+)